MFGLFVHLDLVTLVNGIESCVVAVEEEEQEPGDYWALYLRSCWYRARCTRSMKILNHQ